MAKTPDERAVALEALHALRRRDAYADSALDGLLGRHQELDARARALVSNLVYGVLRWQNRLDAHLARAVRRPLGRTHPVVLDILRLGAFQILFLDRVPDRAAVSESVELTRRSGFPHAASFVNATLRKVSDLGRELPLPEDPPGRLSLLFGCPVWLVEEWLSAFGEEGAENLCRTASNIPGLTLRVDTRKLSREDAAEAIAESGVASGPGEWSPEALWVEGGGGDPRALRPVYTGVAVVQDQASQLVAHLLAPLPGWRVVDACAAPGLKATHLAQLMDNQGEVLALDVHPHRVRMIEELARRLGATCVRPSTADASQWEPDGEVDAALVDAPCSGLGVLSRNPDSKWRRRPEDLAEFPPLQLSILKNVAKAVRPGGVLVYATCTTPRAENEGVVEALLRERPDFAVAPPAPGPVSWEGLVTPDGYFRTFPGAVGEGRGRALDGFFGARLIRKSA